MKAKLFCILGSVLCIVISSCDSLADPDDDHSEKRGLSFIVKDANGNPLDSVGVHFIFSNWSSILSKDRQHGSTHVMGISSIELISFSAIVADDHIRLDRATASESNNLGFEIERSEEGGPYSLLSSYTANNDLMGHGTTTDRHDYVYPDFAVTEGHQYSYKLIDIDSSGVRVESGPVTVTMTDIPTLPSEFQLGQNYPNPFNPSTAIPFTLPQAVHVLLQVSNWWDGEPVRTLVDGFLEADYHTVRWDAQDDDGNYVTNNVYAYQMIAGDYSAQREMCLLMGDPEHIRSLDCIPLATTAADGHADIDYSVIPLGKSINRTDEQGNLLGTFMVTDTLDFIFLKEGYKSLLERTVIDTSKALNVSVTLESN